MSKFDKFNEAFLNFLDQRSTHEEFIGANEEFQDNKRELEDLYKQLKAFLPKGSKEADGLMTKLDNHTYHVITKGVDAGYRQGFSEGIKLILTAIMLDH